MSDLGVHDGRNTHFTVHGGKTYLLSTTDAKKAFDDMPDGIIQKADVQWASLKK